MTGGAGKSGILGLRRDSESDDKLNCDLFSLATVRSHRGGRLQADNNSGDRERLKLFRDVDGVSVCEDMSAPVKNVLDSEELFNGDKVILEYVENNASSIDIS